MVGQMVLRRRELIKDSVRAEIDDRPFALGHVLYTVAVGTAFRIMLDQENDSLHCPSLATAA